MSVESEEFTELGDEFALVAQRAEEAGATGRALPRVRRGWVNVPAGGHVSGVFWGDAQPEIVFLHDLGESARAWDAVAVTVGPAPATPSRSGGNWRRWAPQPCSSATNGRLRPARHRVVAGGSVTRRSVATFYYSGLEQVLEPLPPFLEPGEETDCEPVTQWDLVKDGVEDYLKVFGRPAQVAAWREGRPYVAELAENSAGR
jgi:hypothetical protein